MALKLRKISANEIDQLGTKLIEDCRNGTFQGGVISAKKAVARYNVALNAFKEILLNAYGKGLTGYQLTVDTPSTLPLECATINKKGTLTIPQKRMAKLIQRLPETLRYTHGQTFTETVDETGVITLTPNR